MCFNFRPTKKRAFIGFKVVAKHKNSGRYYSVFTGKPYPLAGSIPHWKSQKPIGNNFIIFLNDQGKQEKQRGAQSAWQEEMIGRTSAFKTLNDAQTLQLSASHGMRTTDREKFQIVVVKVKLTEDVMLANYSLGLDLYVIYDRVETGVGRQMEILKEVN